ncbi:hypothetical protein INT48_001109 [Thamnidium elegans]|uniref:Fanconi anemia group I protein n=1 Tax=Thamnidium elegans TaxID=101142 RepID=A0A8H7SQL0_9FUNG|nr:hypothetical protein INT48_001109 [Thamnidium elegans]
MDAEIFKLNKQSNKRKLVEFLNETSNEQISSLLKEKLDDYHAKNDVDTILVLRALFQGSPIEEGHIQRRFQIIQSVIEWLSIEDKENADKSKQASHVVNLVLPEIELLPTDMLRNAGISITKIIDENEAVQLRILDIFSKVWNVLSAADELNHLSDIFDHLMQANWNNQIVVGISSALNEMELSNSQLETIIKHMIRKLADMEMEEVPPFIYQLLLISRKGYKRVILSGILDYFNSNTIDSSMEGTVMLHISFAIKQDKDLGNELVKLIKNDKSSQLQVFNIACLLSVARIHRLQDTIFDLFKTSIVSIYKDKEKSDRALWIAEYCPLDAEKFSQVLLDVVEKSALGWDQVIQSLAQLALILIDTVSNSDSAAKTKSSSVKHYGANEQVASLGVNILLQLFKYHDVVRSEILEQITSRIVSRSDSVMDFLRLLQHIIQEYPDEVEKYLTNIKDTLDFLSFLPLPTAQRLLSAIQPVAKSNEQFRDGLILILRKSLFAKDSDGRQMAVGGFLSILNDQLTEIKNGDNDGQAVVAEGVAFEILGLLRRCFSQQYEIRSNAYHGLGALSQEHPSFAGDIFELLYTQFMRTFEKDSSIINPIKLEVCIENATNGAYPKMLEPVHVLLANLIKALYATRLETPSAVTVDTISQFKMTMKSFVTRLSRATLEDFELEKTNFDMATHIGLRNTQYATLLLVTLYKKRKELVGLLNNSTNEKGKKNTSINIQYCVSFQFISKLFLDVFGKDLKDDIDTPAFEIRRDIDFVQFIVSITCESLRFEIDNEHCHDDETYFKECSQICKVYMHMLQTEDSDSTYANQSSTKKTPSVLVSVASSLLSILETVNNVWPQRFKELLIKLLEPCDINNAKSLNRIIVEVIMQLKDIVQRYMSGRTPIYKEVSGVLQIASYLCGTLDKKQTDFAMRSLHVVQWLDQLAKERSIQDSTLAKDIVSLLIRLGGSIGEYDTIQNICEDIHLYQIINIKTFSTITTQVFEFLDSSLDDLTWCTGRLKLCAAGSDDDLTRSFEKEYCKRIVSLMVILSELVKAVLTDVHAESLFKTLVKAYRTLHTFVKYKILFPREISSDFINVISKAGTEITERMYKFLTVYGQSQQQDTSVKKKGKRKEVNMKQRAKIQRESRMIPNLIFAVEQFERHLIQLSRKSRVDFMQYMKRSTSRDFKIQMSLINQESSDEEEDEKLKRVTRDDSEGEAEGSSAKRHRRDS